MPDLPTIAGLLLTGGESRRFGARKASATLAGSTLQEIALKRLSSTCATIAIAGPPEPQRTGVTYIADPPDLPRGPLSGILAGLEWARSQSIDWLAISPCDMPLLPRDIHHRLLKAARANAAPLAMVTDQAGHGPLCSVWATNLSAQVRQRLTENHPSIWRYAIDLGAVALPLADPELTLNINTPSDLERAATLQQHHWWIPEQT